jgi:alpha-tubulin suppressor-like RCC1 family protein
MYRFFILIVFLVLNSFAEVIDTEIYKVSVGTRHSIVLVTKNDINSFGDLSETKINEPLFTRPSFIKNVIIGEKVPTIEPGNSSRIKIYFEVKDDAKYVGEVGDINLTWHFKNEDEIMSSDTRQSKPWELSVKLEVVGKDSEEAIGNNFTLFSNPPTLTIDEDKTGAHNIWLKNNSDELKTYTIKCQYNGSDKWQIMDDNDRIITLYPMQSKMISPPISVLNDGAVENANIFISATEKGTGIKKTITIIDKPGDPSKSDDHPDDNFSVANSEYPTDWLYDSESKVGVYSNGWGEGLNHLLGKYSVSTCVIKENFTILNEPERSINDIDVLLFGSAGFDGLETSNSFKKQLSDYVENGGTIITFTAKNGTEFSALPGGEVRGFGWDEDQSCFSDAVAVSKYHQILSGQEDNRISANFDGYLTEWPESAEVLLHRTKNGMPAVITYPHGKGQVFVFTSFPDWSYGHNQSTDEDQILVRDAVAWALQSKELPEFGINDSVVEFSFSITNSTNIVTQKVALNVLNPNRELVFSDTILVSVNSNDSTLYDFSYSPTTKTKGIWYVEYSLLNSENKEIQAPRIGEQFVITTPVGVAAKKDFAVNITSEDDMFPRGSDATFTIHLFNNTERDTTVITSFSAYSHESPKDSTVLVPANSSVSFERVLEDLHYSTRFRCNVKNLDGEFVASVEKGFHFYDPSCEIEVSSEKSAYKSGDTVELSTTISNKLDKELSAQLTISLIDPSSTTVSEFSLSTIIDSNGTMTLDSSMVLPNDLLEGIYRLKVEAFSEQNSIGVGYNFIEIGASVAINPQIPSTFSKGDNNVRFILEDATAMGIDRGLLYVQFTSPSGVEIVNSSFPFELNNSLFDTIDVTVPLSSIEFGTYKLKFYSVFGGKTTFVAPREIMSSCIIDVKTDKSSYSARDYANVSVNIVNTGRFDLSGDLIVTNPESSPSSKSKPCELTPGQSFESAFSFKLWENLTSGMKSGLVQFCIDSLGSRSKNYNFSVADYQINLLPIGYSVDRGDSLIIEISNSGGVDVDLINSFELVDMDNVVVASKSISGKIMAVDTISYIFEIPLNVVDGTYKLQYTAETVQFGSRYDFMEYVSINGVNGAITVTPLKETFSSSENKTITVDVDISDSNEVNGKIVSSISRVNKKTRAIPQAAWVNNPIKHVISDGVIYENGEMKLWGDRPNYSLITPKSVEQAIRFNSYSAFLKADGSVVVNSQDSNYQTPPNAFDVKSIAGDGSIAALRVDGSVVAWGNYWHGELLQGFNNIKSIAVGRDFIAGVKDDGHVIVKYRVDDSIVAVPDYVTGIESLSAFGDLYYQSHIIGLKTDGTVIGWGSNSSGQIDIPPGLSDVKSVHTSYGVSMALKNDGTVIAWGDASRYSLNIPSGITDIKELVLVSDQVLALKNDGTVVGWGREGEFRGLEESPIVSSMVTNKSTRHFFIKDVNDKIISGNNNDSYGWWDWYDGMPNEVISAKAASFSKSHGVYLNENGSVGTWGSYPSMRSITSRTSNNNIIDVKAGNKHGLALKSDGSVVEFGGWYWRAAPNNWRYVKDVKQIELSWWSHAALKNDGTVEIWGQIDKNCDGPENLRNVVDIALSCSNWDSRIPFGVAIHEDGMVSTWGTCSKSDDLTIPEGLSGVVKVSAGLDFIVALKSNGSVVAWGNNSLGKIDVPEDLTNVIDIECGFDYTLAMKSDSTIVIWGGPYLTGEKFTSTYDNSLYAVVDAGESSSAIWDSLSSDIRTFSDRGVKVSTRSGETTEKLVATEWTAPTEDFNFPIESSPGRYFEAKVTSNSKYLPIIDQFILESTERTTLWNDTTLSSFSDNTSVDLAPKDISEEGKYFVDAKLLSSLDQEVVKGDAVFSVNRGSLHLTYETNKPVYLRNDTIVIGGTLKNSGETQSDIELRFQNKDTEYFNESLDLAGGTNYEFSFSIPPQEERFSLSGIVNGKEHNTIVLVEKTDLDISVSGPSIVGSQPFSVDVTLSNPNLVDVSVLANIGENTETITIPSNETRVISKAFTVTADSLISIEISGEYGEELGFFADFGEDAIVTILPDSIYPEGTISIPFIVENTGALSIENSTIEFQINGNIVEKQFSVPVSETYNGTVTFSQLSGEYTLGYSCIYDSGSIVYSVGRENQIDITLDVGQFSEPKVFLLQDGSGYDTQFSQVITDNDLDIEISTVTASEWDGTNPSLEEFDVVILPTYYYYQVMPEAGQDSLLEFVNSGGGLITMEEITYGAKYYNNYRNMFDLLLFDTTNIEYGNMWQNAIVSPGHQVTNGIPSTFKPYYSVYGYSGPVKPGVTSLLDSESEFFKNMLVTKNYGAGRILHWGVNTYSLANIISYDINFEKLFINGVKWCGKSDIGTEILAEVTATNNGYNNFEGQLKSSTSFFESNNTISLAPGCSTTFSNILDFSYVDPAVYTYSVDVQQGGRVINNSQSDFEVFGASFELSTTPSDFIVEPSQTCTLSLGISNTGMIEGDVSIEIIAEDFYSEARISRIMPKEEKASEWILQIPDDYPAGDYSIEVLLNGAKFIIPFTVNGIRVSIEHSLDKTIYVIGDTATLTLEIVNEGDIFPEVYAKAASNDDNDRVDFTLSDTNIVTLRIPVSEKSSSRIGYGLYQSGGRAIHLNTLMLRIAEGSTALYTEKDVYNAGDDVIVHIITSDSGNIEISTTSGYEGTYSLSDDSLFTFTLPQELTSGTQTISYTVDGKTRDCKFDVNGYSLRTSEVLVEDDIVDPIDEIGLELNIISNVTISTIIKGWIYDSNGEYHELFEVSRELDSGSNKINISSELSTLTSGRHTVIYGVYKAGSNITLLTGSQSFDVRPAAILSCSPNKDVYNQSESISLAVNTVACGHYSGTLSVMDSDSTVYNQAVSLNGEESHQIEIDGYPVGDYTFSVQLIDSSGVVSKKETLVSIRDLVAPEIPTGLKVAMNIYIPELSWDLVSDNDCSGYNVYRNGEKENPVLIKGNNYSSTRLVPNFDYEFFITAVDMSGNESESSDTVTVTHDNIAPVISITPEDNVTVSEAIEISYSALDNYDPIPIVTANYPSGMVFSEDNEYYLNVYAEDANGNKSQKSVVVTVETGPPTPVQCLTASNTQEGNSVLLDWSNYVAPNDISEYLVYYGPIYSNDMTRLFHNTTVPADQKSFKANFGNGVNAYWAIVPIDVHGNRDSVIYPISFVPSHGTGSIVITTSPSDADVYLNGNCGFVGKHIGTTPDTVSDLIGDRYAPYGNHILQVFKEGYKGQYSTVRVSPNETTFVHIELEPFRSVIFDTTKEVISSGYEYDGETWTHTNTNGKVEGGYSSPHVIDYYADGVKDILSSNEYGELYKFINDANNDSLIFLSDHYTKIDTLGNKTSFFIADYNNDETNDLIVSKMDGTITVWYNEGTECSPLYSPNWYSDLEYTIPRLYTEGNAIVSFADLNNDKLNDLIVGEHSGIITVYYNFGVDTLPDFNSIPDDTLAFVEAGNAAPHLVKDWDSDLDYDLIVGDANGDIYEYINEGSLTHPNFVLRGKLSSINNDLNVGSNATPFIVDFNDDGYKDLVVGNADGDIIFYPGITNIPPEVDAGENLSIKSKDIKSTLIIGLISDINEFDTLKYRWSCNDSMLTDWELLAEDGLCSLSIKGKIKALGTNSVALEASDGSNVSVDEMLLVIENSSPNIIGCGDGVYEIFTDITLCGNVSDFDGDALSYNWTLDSTDFFSGNVETYYGGEPIELPTHYINNLDLGEYQFIVTVSDGITTPQYDTVKVTVIDTTAPALAPIADSYILWPPNHKMIDVVIESNANDNSGEYTLSASISSNEPVEEKKNDKHAPDWTDPVVDQTTGQINFQLRAERLGKGSGRTYIVSVKAEDQSGNSSNVDVQIIVPHNQGN